MGWVLQKFPLGKALSVTVIIWGSMCLCLAACNNYWQLSLVRVLLGWFEAVVIPGFAILTSSWYLRREQTLRQTLYCSMNTFFALVFGVGIYYIALDAQRRGGLAAWRVINLFLGGTTVGMGFICLVFIGTPDEVWWLSKREKLMAKARIVSNATGGGETHPWSWGQVRECFRDRQLWHAVAANFMTCVPNGGLTAFGIIINQSFGFNDLDTILFSLPSYAITCVCVILSGICVYYRPHSRFPIAIASQVWTCFILLFVGFTPDSMNKWIRWAFYCFYPIYSICMFLIFPLMTVNVAGRSKKTVFGAMCLISYCVGVSDLLCPLCPGRCQKLTIRTSLVVRFSLRPTRPGTTAGSPRAPSCSSSTASTSPPCGGTTTSRTSAATPSSPSRAWTRTSASSRCASRARATSPTRRTVTSAIRAKLWGWEGEKG